MQSNYKRLGDYIRPIKNRNSDSLYSELLGINIDKFFMPSVANIVGIDLSKYKVVSKGQFACNRMHVGRDYRIPIALSQVEAPFLISPAYDVFEIKKPLELDAEYLMMWFRRPEFDRNAWFHTDGDVRGGLPWDAFCNLELPIPTIEVQRAMVKEYNTITDRIALNEQLNQKLKETAQALYRHWFEDFEFPYDFEKGEPSLQGQPYKSRGGEMQWCEELEKEIPRGWFAAKLNELGDITHGYAFKGDFISKNENDNVLVTPGNVKIGGGFKGDSLRYYDGEIPDNFVFEPNDLIVTMTDLSKQADTLGYPALIPNSEKRYLHNQRIGKVYLKNELHSSFLYWTMCSQDYRNHVVGGATGTTVKHTSPTRILEYACPMDSDGALISMFGRINSCIMDRVSQSDYEWHRLEQFRALILSKMSTVETGVAGGVGVG